MISVPYLYVGLLTRPVLVNWLFKVMYESEKTNPKLLAYEVNPTFVDRSFPTEKNAVHEVDFCKYNGVYKVDFTKYDEALYHTFTDKLIDGLHQIQPLNSVLNDCCGTMSARYKMMLRFIAGHFLELLFLLMHDLDVYLISALKIINWKLDNHTVRYEFTKDWDAARKSYAHRFNQMTQEVNLLESFTGAKTIVQLKGSCTEKMPELNYWKLYIQMEYLKDLMDFASESHGLTRKQIVKLGIDICTALEACHAKNIIHRDIKPANIMVSPDGYFKLGDFGNARQQISGTMTVTGTWDFMAPEVYKGMPYDQTADIYSLGMVLYFLANGYKLPFSEIQNSINPFYRRVSGNTEWGWKQALSNWGTATSFKQKSYEELLYDTVMTACAYDPKKRYRSAKAMKQDLMLCMHKICRLEKMH